MRYVVGLSLVLPLLVPVLATGAPRIGRPVVLVAPPWTDPVRAVARAGGSILRGTTLPWIVVAVSEEADFAARLRGAGAWLTLDASAIAGCAS